MLVIMQSTEGPLSVILMFLHKIASMYLQFRLILYSFWLIIFQTCSDSSLYLFCLFDISLSFFAFISNFSNCMYSMLINLALFLYLSTVGAT